MKTNYIPHIKVVFFLIIAASTLSFTVYDNPSPEKEGYEKMKKCDLNRKGFRHYIADMEMILTKENGKSFKREIKTYVLEQTNEGEKTVSFFNNPSDVKGTKLLSYSHINETDDQWIYLPALRKAKRIANENKSGSFMGSEVAFEDLGSTRLEKYTYKYVRDDQHKGIDCYIVHSYPKNKYSGYSYIEVWIDKAKMLPIHNKYFDKKRELLKNENQEFIYVQGKCWMPKKFIMSNVKTGRSTTITWNGYNFNEALEDSFFSLPNFEKAE